MLNLKELYLIFILCFFLCFSHLHLQDINAIVHKISYFNHVHIVFQTLMVFTPIYEI